MIVSTLNRRNLEIIKRILQFLKVKEIKREEMEKKMLGRLKGPNSIK